MQEDKNRGFWKGFWIGFGIFIVCALLIGSVMLRSILHGFERLYDRYPQGQETTEGAENEAAARRFEEVMDYVDEHLVLDYDKEEMINEALKAYVNASDDPYSQYLTADEYAAMMEASNGSYCGIGVQIQQDAETMETTVIQVYSSGSAMEEGVKSGDIITAVNGEDVTQMTVDEIVALVRGEEGTTVEVTVYRAPEGKSCRFVLTRRPVEIDTVYWEMKTDGIGYIRLTEFDSVSVTQMESAINALTKEGCRQLILDIRNNPGGLLSSVLDITDFFLNRDELIFSMEDKAGEVYEFTSEAEKTFNGEVIVLVNGNSASASEVLTGCLKDHGAAVIMGERTFGKGIVQGFFTLSDGSAIKLTTEHYKTPNGHDIHQIGIEPDIEGADDPATEDVDELLTQAISYFEGQ